MVDTRRRAPGSQKRTELPSIRRKNLNIDQSKLDRVRDVLGAQTETEAIDQALDLVLFRDELIEGIRRIGGTGGVTNYFLADEEV